MDDNTSINFGDFSQEEADCIRQLSMSIQRQIARDRDRDVDLPSDMDAVNAPNARNILNSLISTQSDDNMVDIHANDDFFDGNHSTNESKNNNDNGPSSTGARSSPSPSTSNKQVDQFHSIPILSTSNQGVIPETPKEQRPVRQRKPKTLFDFSFARSTNSESDIQHKSPNPEISLEVSSNVLVRNSISTNTSRMSTRPLVPSTSSSSIDEALTMVQFRSPINILQDQDTECPSGTFKRFSNKNLQTSDHGTVGLSNFTSQLRNMNTSIVRTIDNGQ